MSEQDHIIRLLALAETGDLAPDELRSVQNHLMICAKCRQAAGDYTFLGSTLRDLPTPQPSAELLAQVRVMAAPKLAQKQTGNREAMLLAPLVASSWIVALVTWPWVRIAGTWALTGWHLPGGGFTAVLAAYSILGFLLAGVAAIAVSRHAGTIGRMQ